MKSALMVLISITMLWSVAVSTGHAEEKGKRESYTILEVNGSIFQKLSEKDTLVQVKVGEALTQDAFLNIVKDASLKMKKASGEMVVLEGPSNGKIQDLLIMKSVLPGDFVKKTLSKVPAVKENEKKVGISTQSAGLTRGAQSPRKSMPYIWKVKKKSQESDKK